MRTTLEKVTDTSERNQSELVEIQEHLRRCVDVTLGKKLFCADLIAFLIILMTKIKQIQVKDLIWNMFQARAFLTGAGCSMNRALVSQSTTLQASGRDRK